MLRLDLFFRALEAYKKLALGNGHDRDLATVMSASLNDEITIVSTQCVINTDWIEAIEQGLVYIEKALNENRQFILSQGEVEPIEKVKRVSKDSVEHLSRHSDLITKDLGDTIIPDKLFEVERLTDFAVYENRFLYMLLVYLQSFLGYRYNKIVDLTNTFKSNTIVKRTIALNKRKITVDLTLNDEIQFDEYFRLNNSAKDEIERIDLLLKAVAHFLATPIMQEVAKKPLLKPPITRTNVLKMNNNFKNAFLCYQFLSLYEGDGFTINEVVKKIQPFEEPLDQEMAQILLLLPFLAYEHGLDLHKTLKKNYEDELFKKRQMELDLQKNRLEQLKRSVEQGSEPYEYMLLLQERNATLEADSIELKKARAQIDNLNQEIATLTADLTQQTMIIEGFEQQIAQIIDTHEATLIRLKDSHDQRLAATITQFEDKIKDIKAAHELEFSTIKSDFNAKIAQKQQALDTLSADLTKTRAEYEQSIAELKQAHLSYVDDMTSRHLSEVNSLRSQYDGTVTGLIKMHEQQIEGLNSQILCHEKEQKRLEQQCLIANARYNSLRAKYDLFEGEDFTTEGAFSEIERQFESFKAFFKDEWKKTKKRIRTQTKLDDGKTNEDDGKTNKDDGKTNEDDDKTNEDDGK